MTLVTLGALNPGRPLNTGLGNVHAGIQDGVTNYNNTVAAAPLKDGAGGAGSAMSLSCIRDFECWWKVAAVAIWSTQDAT
jgi:hypothetical protein